MLSSTFYSLQPISIWRGVRSISFHPSNPTSSQTTRPQARAGPSATAFVLLHSFRNAEEQELGVCSPSRITRGLAHCSGEREGTEKHKPNPDQSVRHLFATAEGGGDLGVQDEDEGGTDGTEGVGPGTLEEGGGSLLLHDLGEAVGGALVDPLGLGLLGLHLETTADRVEGVGGVAGGDGRGLGAGELGGGAEDVVLGLLVGVVPGEGVEEAEVDAAVGDDADDGDADAVVEAADAGGGDGLLEAVEEAVELGLAGPDVGGEAGTGVVEGVDDAEGAGAGEAAGGHVDEEELGKLGVLVGLGEEGLDGVLEGEVEGLGGEVADDVGQVAAPEGADALLGGDAGEAVDDAGVAGDLAGDDLGVGILGLDEELDALDGSGAGLGDGARDTAGNKVQEEIATGRLKGKRLHKTHVRDRYIKRHKQSVPPVNDGPGYAAGAPHAQNSGLSYGSRCQQYRPTEPQPSQADGDVFAQTTQHSSSIPPANDGPGRAAGAPHAQDLASPTVLGTKSIAPAERAAAAAAAADVSERRTMMLLEAEKNDEMDGGWWRNVRLLRRARNKGGRT